MGLKSISLPDLGEGVTEGEIIKIKVSEGEQISMDQTLVEVMTDKASMEVPSSIEGKIEKVLVKEGDIVSVGADLFKVAVEGEVTLEEDVKESPPSKEAAPKKESPPPSKAPQGSPTLAIPSTRKLAGELGLDLKNVKGSGSQGEVKREDLTRHIQVLMKNPSSSPSVSSAPLPTDIKEEKREPVRGIKRLMFESMSLSKATIPHFTIGEEASVEHLVSLKTEMKKRLEKQGLKTGYLPFFIKALIPTLREFPVFGSVYSEATKEIIFRKDVHVGFAVDSPQGLLVPVLKEVQNKKLLEIIKETRELAEAARLGEIKRENLTGASITLTNLGSLGGMYGTPIINPPEMAIMGIYRLFHKVLKNAKGEFEEKPFMNFSLTCDHRFIDGATAARFLKSFISKVEEPSLLLLE